ncbi:helix-turn-helix domain-containing protein [Bacillus cereus group sp. IBL03679]|uniref:helix-turn-helix domain-containing protein n=1 Tax=Bacillus cereus group sp. IBL03679 TaxID=3240095 RepID=UPI003D2F7379
MENIDIKEQFGMSIKYYRNKKGISQEKLAEITGLHRTYISEVERGNRNISLINISKIATALDINVSDLFIYINL